MADSESNPLGHKVFILVRGSGEFKVTPTDGKELNLVSGQPAMLFLEKKETEKCMFFFKRSAKLWITTGADGFTPTLRVERVSGEKLSLQQTSEFKHQNLNFGSLGQAVMGPLQVCAGRDSALGRAVIELLVHDEENDVMLLPGRQPIVWDFEGNRGSSLFMLSTPRDGQVSLLRVALCQGDYSFSMHKSAQLSGGSDMSTAEIKTETLGNLILVQRHGYPTYLRVGAIHKPTLVILQRQFFSKGVGNPYERISLLQTHCKVVRRNHTLHFYPGAASIPADIPIDKGVFHVYATRTLGQVRALANCHIGSQFLNFSVPVVVRGGQAFLQETLNDIQISQLQLFHGQTEQNIYFLFQLELQVEGQSVLFNYDTKEILLGANAERSSLFAAEMGFLQFLGLGIGCMLVLLAGAELLRKCIRKVRTRREAQLLNAGEATGRSRGVSLSSLS